MKKLLFILVVNLVLGVSSYADISFICQYTNSKGKLVGEKTLYEIKNNIVFEDTYKLKNVENLKFKDSVISFNYDPNFASDLGYKNVSYKKINLSTGNLYEIDYKKNGGAETSYGKCEKF